MAMPQNMDVKDLSALLAEGMAAGRDAKASLFQLRVLAACLAGNVPDESFCAAAGEIRAERRDDGWLLSGRVPAALSSGGAVKQCIVLAGGGDEGWMSFRLSCDSPALRLDPVDSLDLLPAVDVVLDSARVGSGTALRRLEDHALVPALFALSAELAGAAGAALDIALERVRTRKVFGRSIGAYQALAHRLVDARMDLDSMQLALDDMAHAGQDGAVARAMALKTLCSQAGPRVVATAQQAHGGEGFHADVPLYRYTRRVQGLCLRLGSRFS